MADSSERYNSLLEIKFYEHGKVPRPTKDLSSSVSSEVPYVLLKINAHNSVGHDFSNYELKENNFKISLSGYQTLVDHSYFDSLRDKSFATLFDALGSYAQKAQKGGIFEIDPKSSLQNMGLFRFAGSLANQNFIMSLQSMAPSFKAFEDIVQDNLNISVSSIGHSKVPPAPLSMSLKLTDPVDYLSVVNPQKETLSSYSAKLVCTKFPDVRLGSVGFNRNGLFGIDLSLGGGSPASFSLRNGSSPKLSEQHRSAQSYFLRESLSSALSHIRSVDREFSTFSESFGGRNVSSLTSEEKKARAASLRFLSENKEYLGVEVRESLDPIFRSLEKNSVLGKKKDRSLSS